MSLAGQSLAINGIRLNVVVEGTGPSVLLLHGFPDSAYLWRNQIPALKDAGFRVIAPDLRGFGDSDAPSGRTHYTIDTIMQDILDLMSQLHVDHATVIGHDWGAIIGWVLAIRYPERVERYVALSVGHPKAFRSAGLEQKLRSWYALSFQIPGLAEKLTAMGDWFLLHRIKHPEVAHWIKDLSREGRLTAGINWYRANIMSMLFSDFPPVRIPVLGIWSTGDSYLTEVQMKNSAAQVIAPWCYERIEGSSHWIPLDAPDRLNNILLGYLRNADGA